jgi:hypothetical protein
MVRRQTKEDWELKKGGTIENEMEGNDWKVKGKRRRLIFYSTRSQRAPAAASAGELLNISASICIHGRVL